MTLAEIGVCMFAGSMALLLIWAFCMMVKTVFEMFVVGEWLEGMLCGLVVMMMVGFMIIALGSGSMEGLQ